MTLSISVRELRLGNRAMVWRIENCLLFGCSCLTNERKAAMDRYGDGRAVFEMQNKPKSNFIVSLQAVQLYNGCAVIHFLYYCVV